MTRPFSSQGRIRTRPLSACSLSPPTVTRKRSTRKKRSRPRRPNMRIQMDADASEIANFAPAPEGEYVLRVVKVDEGTTKNQDPLLKLETEIDGGQYDGKKVWLNLA